MTSKRTNSSAAMKPKGPKFEKLDRDVIARLGVTKRPTLDYSWRRGAETNAIPSLVTTGKVACSSNSVMDPMNLQKESPETQAAIIAKSKRIAIAFNKGSYQYVTDDADPKTIGRK